MNLVLKLLSSPWFWLDIFLSISGGIIVWWGLRVEKKAEKLLPPEDFKPDLFDDIIKKQKLEVERGWRILMLGVVVEVIAAFLISILSGLEIADLSEKTSAANLEAKQALKDATDEKVYVAQLETTNSLIVSNNLTLEARMQPRIITLEQEKKFILLCKNLPKTPIKVYIGVPVNETEIFATQVRQMLDDAGFGGPNAGIVRDPTLYLTYPMGTFELSPIIIMKNDVNTIGSIGGPVIPATVNEEIVGEVGGNLSAIGFKTTWFLSDQTKYLATGEAAFFIPPKTLVNE